MRVISQDGETDVPYENVALEESYAGKFVDGLYSWKIVAYFALQERHKCMALYSSEKKAIKAMEMLREAYLTRMELDGSYNLVHHFYVQPNYWVLPKVFQFPQDEEIEV